MGSESRLEALRAQVVAAGLDAFVVSAVHHVRYLAGFTGDASYLLVTRERAILVSDDRFALQIAGECPGLEAAIRGHDRSTPQLLGDVIAGLGARSIGLESAYVTLAALEKFEEAVPGATFVPKAGWIEKQRAIKDAGEIATLRKSVAIAQAGFAAFRRALQPADTEYELVNRMEFALRGAGASESAFPTIAGVGERSALPHCPPSDKRLEEADFLLVDWGASFAGYKSDLTRVIRSPFARGDRFGAIESRLRDLYNSVFEAEARGAAALRPGATARQVDAAARGYLEDRGLNRYFTHGLGHGFGLEIHEAPALRANSDDVLQAGMVVTLEPGVYLADFAGVRLENDYRITPDGAEKLSTLPCDWDFFAAADGH